MSSRYRIPDPLCRHAKQDVRTEAGNPRRPPHASVWTCRRTACVTDAIEWAYAKTHILPTTYWPEEAA